MPLPAACQAIEDQLNALRAQLKNLEARLIEGPNDPSPGKPDPLTREEVGLMEAQVRRKQGQFDQCLLDHHLKPDQPVTFKGSAKLTLHDGPGEGTFTQDVTIGLLFVKTHHHKFFVTDFPSITVHTGHGNVVITQSGGGDGTFDPASGAVTLHVKLDFDLPDPEGTSHITFDFATSPDGSPVNSAT